MAICSRCVSHVWKSLFLLSDRLIGRTSSLDLVSGCARTLAALVFIAHALSKIIGQVNSEIWGIIQSFSTNEFVTQRSIDNTLV